MNPKERVWPAIMIVPTTDAVEPLALALDKRLGSLNLIDQAEPYASLHPLGEGLQHALRPHMTFHPLPILGSGFSRLRSPFGHFRGFHFVLRGLHASTFLRPFAPRELPRFFATMDALTPARGALRTQHKRNEHPPWPGQVSPVHMTRTSLHSVTNHPTRPVIAFPLPTQRDRLPEPGLRPAVPMPCRGLANLWQTSCLRPRPGLDFTINEEARRYVRPNRVRFTTDCKFASGCSPPRLATTQLPSAIGSGHLPGEDLHLSDRACSQAHSFPAKPGIQEKEPCMAKQSQVMGKSLEDTMDRAGQSRVERSLWRDPRLDWIPAFSGE